MPLIEKFLSYIFFEKSKTKKHFYICAHNKTKNFQRKTSEYARRERSILFNALISMRYYSNDMIWIFPQTTLYSNDENGSFLRWHVAETNPKFIYVFQENQSRR